MENKELDQLFKTRLEATAVYSRPEEQWEVVAARLAAPRRRRAWWWLGGSSLLLLLSLFLLKATIMNSTPVLSAWKIPLASTVNLPKGPLATMATAASVVENKRSEIARATTDLLPAVTARKETTTLILPVENTAAPKEETAVSSFMAAPLSETERRDFTYHYPQSNSSGSRAAELGGEVRKLAPSPWSAIKSNAPLISPPLPSVVITEEPLTQVASAKSIRIEAGINRAFIPNERVTHTPLSQQWYTGLAVKLAPRWQAGVQYSQGAISRSIIGDPEAYNIAVIDPPEENAIPTTTEIQYQQQSLDVTLAYQLWAVRQWRFSLLGTTQWSNNKDIRAVYDYNGIYLPTTVNGELPDTEIRLSALSAGFEVSFPITNHILLTGRYQQYYSSGKNTFQWPLRHQLQIGAAYQF